MVSASVFATIENTDCDNGLIMASHAIANTPCSAEQILAGIGVRDPRTSNPESNS